MDARVSHNKSRSSNSYSSGEDSDDEGTSESRSSRRQGLRPINGVAYEEFTVRIVSVVTGLVLLLTGDLFHSLHSIGTV